MQACLVETKDVYERAIGDAPLALEQPYDRGQQRVENASRRLHALVASFGGHVVACPDQDFAISSTTSLWPFDELTVGPPVPRLEVELPLERA